MASLQKRWKYTFRNEWLLGVLFSATPVIYLFIYFNVLQSTFVCLFWCSFEGVLRMKNLRKDERAWNLRKTDSSHNYWKSHGSCARRYEIYYLKWNKKYIFLINACIDIYGSPDSGLIMIDKGRIWPASKYVSGKLCRKFRRLVIWRINIYRPFIMKERFGVHKCLFVTPPSSCFTFRIYKLVFTSTHEF